jgi:hypothetical protein
MMNLYKITNPFKNTWYKFAEEAVMEENGVIQENNIDKPGDSNEITSDEPVEPVRGPIINTNEEKLDDDVSDVSDIDDDDEELIKAKDPVLLIGDLSLKDIPINDKTEETELLKEYIIMEKEKLDEGRKTFQEDKDKYEKFKQDLQ